MVDVDFLQASKRSSWSSCGRSLAAAGGRTAEAGCVAKVGCAGSLGWGRISHHVAVGGSLRHACLLRKHFGESWQQGQLSISGKGHVRVAENQLGGLGSRSHGVAACMRPSARKRWRNRDSPTLPYVPGEGWGPKSGRRNSGRLSIAQLSTPQAITLEALQNDAVLRVQNPSRTALL